MSGILIEWSVFGDSRVGFAFSFFFPFHVLCLYCVTEDVIWMHEPLLECDLNYAQLLRFWFIIREHYKIVSFVIWFLGFSSSVHRYLLEISC